MKAAVLPLALALSACVAAAAPPPVDAPDGPPADTCDQAAGQRFVGQQATSESGGAMLRATGTREIRWVPPDTAVTMDYKFGRLTVSYDQNRTILRVSCG